MGIVHSGVRNPNWRGGRSVTSHGYVIVRVGRDHPLADVRGYAYEHRLKAYNEGRLTAADPRIVHHANEIKADNDSSNLEPMSAAAHRSQHAHAQIAVLELLNAGPMTARQLCEKLNKNRGAVKSTLRALRIKGLALASGDHIWRSNVQNVD